MGAKQRHLQPRRSRGGACGEVSNEPAVASVGTRGSSVDTSSSGSGVAARGCCLRRLHRGRLHMGRLHRGGYIGVGYNRLRAAAVCDGGARGQE